VVASQIDCEQMVGLDGKSVLKIDLKGRITVLLHPNGGTGGFVGRLWHAPEKTLKSLRYRRICPSRLRKNDEFLRAGD
jgi:hypothetical protein